MLSKNYCTYMPTLTYFTSNQYLILFIVMRTYEEYIDWAMKVLKIHFNSRVFEIVLGY